MIDVFLVCITEYTVFESNWLHLVWSSLKNYHPKMTFMYLTAKTGTVSRGFLVVAMTTVEEWSCKDLSWVPLVHLQSIKPFVPDADFCILIHPWWAFKYYS